MKNKLRLKKAFTLIELIVVIAILGILVLLASPRFFGHTQNAELTKGFANARTIEKASELYYMDHEDWPRLTDEPYTSEEIKSYSERIFDRTGQEVNLDPEGNYYDIDYDKLSEYIQFPDDKKNYILQNPVGKVYYMENLNEIGIARVNYSNVKEENNNPIPIGGLTNPVVSREPIGEEIAINSADELTKIGKDYPLDGDYILTSDINLSHIDNWMPIGRSNSKFTGSFNGNGYKITGLKINRSTTNYVGLFGSTSKATIENVALEDINVNGGGCTGGLVGYLSGTITNSYATGKVTGTRSYTGGLVGEVDTSTTITSSYATGSVTGTYSTGGLVGYAYGSITNSYATGSVTGRNKAGGLVGRTSSLTIENSYATGSVTGTGDSTGGLVGFVDTSTTITNSYATGKVIGKSYTGGLVGEVNSNPTSDGTSRIKITSSYWNTETTGRTNSSGGGIRKSTEEMMKQTTYSGWDFSNIWQINEGQSYPTLR